QLTQLTPPTPAHAQPAPAQVQTLRITPPQAAATLARDWKLPALLAIPMSHHHDPAGVPDPFLRRLSTVIGLASRFADVFTDEDPAPAIKDLREISRNEFAWTSADCDELLAQTAIQTREQAPLFE